VNYYPFHIGDYVSATRHLSWEEDAAFRRLLDTYYTTEKAIPTDFRQACRLVMAQTESQREAVQTVLSEFFELTDSGWINKRADAEISAMKEKQQKQRDKANKRWANAATDNAAMPQHEKSDAVASKNDADAMPPTPTPTPTPTPRNRNTTPAPSAWVSSSELISDGLPESLAGEWLAHRKAKKAKLTALAWAGFKAEASKAGWTVEEAVRKALFRNWTAFEADWVGNASTFARDGPANRQASIEARNKAAGEEWLRQEGVV
jgi:uncharacterized protein YdaU (DUF1376 family)